MRPRTQAFTLNSIKKYKIAKEFEVSGAKEDNEKLVDNGFLKEKLFEKDENRITPHFLKIEPPDTESKSKNKMTVKIHERAKICKFKVPNYESISEKEIKLDFNTLMAMFENEEEIAEINYEDLFGIETEKLGQASEKINSMISLANSSNDENTKNTVIEELSQMKNEIENNINNLEVAYSKVDQIDSIIFGKKTKILFKKS